MVTIKVYGAIDEEMEFLRAWEDDHPGVTLDITKDELTLKTVHQAQGCQGVTSMQMEYVQEPVYSQLAAMGIKNIAQRSAGFDMYDLQAASQAGIVITNVPSYSPESIAEFTLFSALRLIRHPRQVQARVQDHNFLWQGEIMSRPLNDMIVAVIGVGRIGSRVARIFKDGIGAQVVAYDIDPKPEYAKWVDYKDSLEEAITGADIVTLHMPLNELNHRLFNRETLAQMKSGSILINTARGKIVVTEDLIEAIDSGHLAGAALDVYEHEHAYIPKDWRGKDLGDPLFQRLIDHDKIVYTPHVAYYTDIAVKNIAEGGLNSTLEVIETGTSQYRVN